MPTYEAAESFFRDLSRLTAEQRLEWGVGLQKFIEDVTAIETGQSTSFRAGLRVKPYKKAPGVFEMSWASDGRSLWKYGEPLAEDKRHVQWLRIGTHDIF